MIVAVTIKTLVNCFNSLPALRICCISYYNMMIVLLYYFPSNHHREGFDFSDLPVPFVLQTSIWIVHVSCLKDLFPFTKMFYRTFLVTWRYMSVLCLIVFDIPQDSKQGCLLKLWSNMLNWV